MTFGKATYKYYRKNKGPRTNHKLLGKRVYYRPYSSTVVPKYQGKYAGTVIQARKVHKGYILLAVKRGKKIGYARARELTTRKPKAKGRRKRR